MLETPGEGAKAVALEWTASRAAVGLASEQDAVLPTEPGIYLRGYTDLSARFCALLAAFRGARRGSALRQNPYITLARNARYEPSSAAQSGA